MSNTTFNMSSDRVEGPVPRPRDREALSPDSRDSNSSPSPDSNSSVSNLSDGEADGSPDVNLLECRLSDGSYSATVPQDNGFCGVNLNQTFITTPVDGSVNVWNSTVSLMSDHEMGLEEHQSFGKDAENGCSGAALSPDSAGRESQPSSGETSRRGSTENDRCSLSSAEMVIRSNSFCQGDQSLLVVSSLEESYISLAAGHAAFPSESNLLSTTLPDVLEKSTDGVTEENADYPRLGKTFTQADLPPQENYITASDSLVALPSESGGLLTTFHCESSPAGCGDEAQFACVETEPSPRFPEAFTPEQGQVFSSALTAVEHTDMDVQTSTPVQHSVNMIPIPSFSESPCTGNTGLQPEKQQHISVTPHCLGLTPSASKGKKMEIKKFPRLNFSSIKSKVLTRSGHQKSGLSLVSLHKPSHVSNKVTEAQSGAPVKRSPANSRSRAALIATTTSKLVTDAQKRMNTGAANLGVTFLQSNEHSAVDGPGESGAANKHGPTVQSGGAGSEVELAASSQVADAAVLQSGKKTLCVSSSENKPTRSCPTDPKPTPKKGVVNKMEVPSGSTSGPDKPLVLKMRLRCSSDSLPSSSREKGTTLKLSTSFTAPKADAHLGQTTLGNLSGSSLNKQTEATNVPVEISPREVKRISLVAQSSKSAPAGAASDESRSRFRGLMSRQPRGGAPLLECRTSKAVGTPQSKQKSSTGSRTVQAPGEPSLGAASAASIKPQLHRARPPQTPTRPSSLMGPPPTPSRLPRRTPGPSGTLAEAGVHAELSEGAGSTQVSGGPSHKPSPFKNLKARLIPTPRKNTGLSSASACRPAAASTSKASSNPTASPLKRTASARFRLSAPVAFSQQCQSSCFQLMS
ncbi:uncharacterized protein LOC130209394 isoform X2 [Pseudoliparis swirei]|uniref:uncharacterized protein LOC130209394 isoform X2 n=1 Tax=Pseudoliparis swirei TaxID=2059687 RepID=UPI0024BE15FB|nr:uncharacterized protein LOC130209394 isoform X2 [Pseudoliparis swirei]